jgi:hypothetical protein
MPMVGFGCAGGIQRRCAVRAHSLVLDAKPGRPCSPPLGAKLVLPQAHARFHVRPCWQGPRDTVFSLHGIMRRCPQAERLGVPARLSGGWPKVPLEHTVNSVSGASSRAADLTRREVELALRAGYRLLDTAQVIMLSSRWALAYNPRIRHTCSLTYVRQRTRTAARSWGYIRLSLRSTAHPLATRFLIINMQSLFFESDNRIYPYGRARSGATTKPRSRRASSRAACRGRRSGSPRRCARNLKSIRVDRFYHRNVWANVHLSGQPHTFLAQRCTRATSAPRGSTRPSPPPCAGCAPATWTSCCCTTPAAGGTSATATRRRRVRDSRRRVVPPHAVERASMRHH